MDREGARLGTWVSLGKDGRLHLRWRGHHAGEAPPNTSTGERLATEEALRSEAREHEPVLPECNGATADETLKRARQLGATMLGARCPESPGTPQLCGPRAQSFGRICCETLRAAVVCAQMHNKVTRPRGAPDGGGDSSAGGLHYPPLPRTVPLL